MRATSIGHAGILVDTVDGSIVCDPWFVPQFFGSWFVFPRNDQLRPELIERICNPTYLYISHIHGAHLDEVWLSTMINKDTTVLVPGHPTRELERTLRGLGFHNVVRTVDGEEMALGPHLSVAIHCEAGHGLGPVAGSAIVISDGTGRLVNQNDFLPADPSTLRSHGPVDLHWLQYSGAGWFPMALEETPQRMRELVAAHVAARSTRAMLEVESVGARAVVPSSGPPAFLDPDLFRLNSLAGHEPSTFIDQADFIAQLAEAGHNGILAVPGSEIDLTGDGALLVTHPLPITDVEAIFADKEAYLRLYQADWLPWLNQMKAGWSSTTTNLLATIKAWWEPLMAMAPTLCDAIGEVVVVEAGELPIAIDFPRREVRVWIGEPHGLRFHVGRDLFETVVAEGAADWVNGLLVSCRFQAWSDGGNKAHIDAFFSSLSVERMHITEARAVSELGPAGGGAHDGDVLIGDWLVQRICPHRLADLGVFGEIDGDELVCTMHGWRFDLPSGRCLNADCRPLRVRRTVPD